MKTQFQQLGKSYAKAAEEIGCSKTMLLNFINDGTLPK